MEGHPTYYDLKYDEAHGPSLSIKDDYGADLNDLEILERLDRDFLVGADVHVKWMSKRG